jgi:hypothetical protein
MFEEAPTHYYFNNGGYFGSLGAIIKGLEL